MPAPSLMLSWIVVKNLDEAIDFYTKTVGLKLDSKEENYKWAELSGSMGQHLGIAEQNDLDALPPGVNAILTLGVDDIHKTIDDFKKRGVKLEGEPMTVPGHVILQTFFDASGNRLQLVQQLSEK